MIRLALIVAAFAAPFVVYALWRRYAARRPQGAARRGFLLAALVLGVALATATAATLWDGGARAPPDARYSAPTLKPDGGVAPGGFAPR